MVGCRFGPGRRAGFLKGSEGGMDRKNMLLPVQHPPVYKSGVEWALFTAQRGANALTEMMLMHYTGSCSDIFRAAAEGCDGLPLSPEQTNTLILTTHVQK